MENTEPMFEDGGWGPFDSSIFKEDLEKELNLKAKELAKQLLYDLIISEQEARERFYQHALGYGVWTIEKLLRVKPYSEYLVKKKDWSYRKICAPDEQLKHVQKLLLDQFFYRILARSRKGEKRIDDNGKLKWRNNYDFVAKSLSRHLRGFLPEIPLKKNASPHLALYRRKKYVATIDLKKAFDNISVDMVKATLLDIVFKEYAMIKEISRRRNSGEYVSRIWHLMYPTPSLFPKTKVAWLRKLMRNEHRETLVKKTLTTFVEYVTELCTYKGALPQGAPTSPFLLNLVLSFYKLPEDLLVYVKQITESTNCNITVYADDITISGGGKMNKNISEKIESFIEEKGFPVNKKKTKIFYVKGQTPEITGLSIATKVVEVSKKAPGDGKTMLMNRNVYSVAIPKRKIKAIRAFIHNATYVRFNETTHRKILGYIAYARGIYGKELPNQLWKPWLKYKTIHKI